MPNLFLLFTIHLSVALQDKTGILESLGMDTYRFVCFQSIYLYLVSPTALRLFLLFSVNVGVSIQMLYCFWDGASLGSILE